MFLFLALAVLQSQDLLGSTYQWSASAGKGWEAMKGNGELGGGGWRRYGPLEHLLVVGMFLFFVLLVTFLLLACFFLFFWFRMVDVQIDPDESKWAIQIRGCSPDHLQGIPELTFHSLPRSWARAGNIEIRLRANTVEAMDKSPRK